MKRRAIRYRALAILGLMLAAASPRIAAQEPEDRLHELRMRRLQEALRLDDDQAAAVAEAMEQVRRAQREGRRREMAAFERLRSSLRSEPVDQEGVRAALEAIEAERETVVRVRREQAERLEERLTPEQRARLMLFNRQFEHRLRELMIERRGGVGPGRGGIGPERPRRRP